MLFYNLLIKCILYYFAKHFDCSYHLSLHLFNILLIYLSIVHMLHFDIYLITQFDRLFSIFP